jgi:Nucleotidyltransferase of unknown function (DUF6036)
MPGLATDLWSLIDGRPQIDPDDLASAVQEQAAAEPLDYRTRLLIRDSLNALKSHWGAERFTMWLAGCPVHQRLESICLEDFERPGFTLIGRRLMEKTPPKAIQSLLSELGVKIRQPMRLNVLGSAALILSGYLSRQTEDIDVVDEVPREVREQYKLLDDFKQRYGLLLTRFGSHYLPTGWENRLHFFDEFGELRIYLVDVADIFVGKLFSKRTKDLDDLRMLAPQLEKAALAERLKSSTTALQNDPNLLALAQQSWYIVFGEALPQ